jgi:hypothetical protein
MPSSPSRRMKIGAFLLLRLAEAGVRHLSGVPGDYNLVLVQQRQDSGTLQWIGTCSALKASYAADGYARLNGLGALLVTNGVGALGAINSVGGSYTLPADSELLPALTDFRQSFSRPGPLARLAKPEALGLNTDSDLERRLGRRVVESAPDLLIAQT